VPYRGGEEGLKGGDIKRRGVKECFAASVKKASGQKYHQEVAIVPLNSLKKETGNTFSGKRKKMETVQKGSVLGGREDESKNTALRVPNKGEDSTLRLEERRKEKLPERRKNLRLKIKGVSKDSRFHSYARSV